MRDIIIAEIKRIASANGGKAPGSNLFTTETGIPEHKWRGVHWARWSEALADAGYRANSWQQKHDPASLLETLAALTKAKGHVPSNAELRLMRRSDASVPVPQTLVKHFQNRAALVEALRAHCMNHASLSDVVDLLPASVRRRETVRGQPLEGWVYLLKSGQHYKIGRSDQLEARVKKISIALPEATALVHAIRTDDPPGIEAYWHRRFDDRRANGEWFKLSAADVAAFTRRKFQ